MKVPFETLFFKFLHDPEFKLSEIAKNNLNLTTYA